MEKLNRHNYGAWIVDYYEGNLNAAQVNKLRQFLEANPDLNEEFEQFSVAELASEETVYPDKSGLKKRALVSHQGFDEDNYEEKFIAFHEDDLNTQEKEHLEAFLQLNPHLNEEFTLTSKLYLEADENIVFRQKASLKRRAGIIAYRWVGVSVAAASILLLFWIIPEVRQEKLSERELLSVSELPARAMIVNLQSDLRVSLSVVFQEPTPLSLHSTSEAYTPSPQLSELTARNHDTGITAPAIDYSLLPFLPSNDFSTGIALAATASEQREKSGLLARVAKNLLGKAGLRKKERQVEEKPRDPTFVRILDQSITVFNTLTGSESELVKVYDDEGKLTRYEFEGESISWRRDVAPTRNQE